MKKKTKSLLLISAAFTSVFSLSLTTALTTNQPVEKTQLNQNQLANKAQVAANGKLDGFQSDLKNYSGYDLAKLDQKATDLLLDNLIQFKDGKFIKDPLLTTNVNKDEFVNRFFISFVIQNDESKLGTEISLTINYRDDKSQTQTKKVTLENLKPKVIFDLNLNNQNQYDLKLQPEVAYDSAYEFAANFEQKIQEKLISYQNSKIDDALVQTNIQKTDFSKFRPVFKLGTIDNINGTITNNSISILVPTLNVGNSSWDLNEDQFSLETFKFDLINFQKQPIFIDYVKNGVFDVGKNFKLKNLTANDFNQEVFLQNLVQYNSTFLNQNYLVAINYDIDTFSKALTNFTIENIDATEGELDLSFQLRINDVNSSHHYQIRGFKKVVNIENQTTTINKKNYQLLNQKDLAEIFQNSDQANLIKFISQNINFFFANDDQAIFKTSIDNFPSLFLNGIDLKFFKTLGQIKITFKVNLNALDDRVLYLNDQLLRLDQLSLVIDGFQSKKVVFELNKDKINDPKAYDSLSNFVDNFVDFTQEVNLDPSEHPDHDKLRAISRFSAIRTNLTKEEFNHIVNISFDRSDEYKIALVKIDYLLNNENKQIKIAINSINNPITYQVSQKPFDVSKYPEWKNKSVDDFSKDDLLNLIGFNDQPNQYGILTVNASRALFENVLLKNFTINKHFDSIDIELDLVNSVNRSVKKTIKVINLNWRLNEIALWSILAAAGLVALIIAIIIIAQIRRSYMKRKVLKVNNWNQFDEGGK